MKNVTWRESRKLRSLILNLIEMLGKI